MPNFVFHILVFVWARFLVFIEVFLALSEIRLNGPLFLFTAKQQFRPLLWPDMIQFQASKTIQDCNMSNIAKTQETVFKKR